MKKKMETEQHHSLHVKYWLDTCQYCPQSFILEGSAGSMSPF